MKKTTPIEWLITQIVEDQMTKNKSVQEWQAIFLQARAIEKNHIFKFAEWFKESDWQYFDNTEKGNVYCDLLVTEDLLTIEEIYQKYYLDIV